MARSALLNTTMDMRPVLMATGALVCVLAIFMMIAGLADYFVFNEKWRIFMNVGLVTFVAGTLMYFPNKVIAPDLDIRQAFY